MRKYLVFGIIAAILIIIAGALFIIQKNKATVETVVSDYNSNNFDSAITSAEDILRRDPENVSALLALAATYAQKGSVTFKEDQYAKRAIEFADKVIAIQPGNSEAYRIKGYAYEIQELYTEAHEQYDLAIKYDSNNSQAMSNKGHAFDLQGDIESAKNWYTKALEVNSQNDHALLNLARVYIREGVTEDARIKLDSLLSSSQNTRFKADAYQLLASISFDEFEYDQAFDEVNQALALDEGLSQAWVLKAKIELANALNIADEAGALEQLISIVRADAGKALAINPNQTSAYIVLSEVEIITGNSAAYNDYRNKAAQAIDLDITLGAKEKAEVREYLGIKVKTEN